MYVAVFIFNKISSSVLNSEFIRNNNSHLEIRAVMVMCEINVRSFV